VLTEPALSNRSNEPTRPVTFGSMRRLGVRSLAVTYRCHHETIINADRWSGQMRVPSFGPRRPNWREQPARESLRTQLR
jgi:hypothetical protein